MTTLVELFDDRCARFASRPVIGEKRDGEWRWITYAELHERVADLRAGLAHLGVGPTDRVAIVAGNGVVWATSAYATYGLGAAFVPMYEAQRPDEWRFILADSGAKVVIASTARVADAIEAGAAELPALAHVVRADAPERDPRSFEALLAIGRDHPLEQPPTVPPEAIAGLVYTSGTTGMPKGVVLTHANLASNVTAVTALFPIGPSDRTLSFLPWAHAYGQVAELHVIIGCGASTAICTRVEKLVDELAEVRPTILVAVPRIFNKLHDRVRTQIAGRPRLVRALFHAGLAASLERQRGVRLGWRQRLIRWLADRIVFRRVRAHLGGRVRFAFTGSAVLSREVAEFIDALGIPVYEGYGLTETSPVVSTNRPGARRMGSVGLPIGGVTVRIEPVAQGEPGEGEIVVYGPNVMAGYHHRPEETAAAIGADGGLHTGDLGRLDADGYLWITGRIKEQYKLENGKYVMPGPLEQALALSPYIANVMLYGAGKPHNVALVVLERDAVRAWAEHEGVELGDDPTESPAVRTLIAGELAREAAAFRAYERPRDFVMTARDFTVAEDLLTPTLKLKRKSVIARYGARLEALYGRPRITPSPAAAHA